MESFIFWGVMGAEVCESSCFFRSTEAAKLFGLGDAEEPFRLLCVWECMGLPIPTGDVLHVWRIWHIYRTFSCSFTLLFFFLFFITIVSFLISLFRLFVYSLLSFFFLYWSLLPLLSRRCLILFTLYVNYYFFPSIFLIYCGSLVLAQLSHSLPPFRISNPCCIIDCRVYCYEICIFSWMGARGEAWDAVECY